MWDLIREVSVDSAQWLMQKLTAGPSAEENVSGVLSQKWEICIISLPTQA